MARFISLKIKSVSVELELFLADLGSGAGRGKVHALRQPVSAPCLLGQGQCVVPLFYEQCVDEPTGFSLVAETEGLFIV